MAIGLFVFNGNDAPEEQTLDPTKEIVGNLGESTGQSVAETGVDPTDTVEPPTATPVPTDTPQPTNTPIPTPTIIRLGVPVASPLNSQEASAWFPRIDALSGGGVVEVPNSALPSSSDPAYMAQIGRITSFTQTYSFQPACNSSDGLEGAFIQAFFFKDATGAGLFMNWATNNWTYAGVNQRFDVGQISYQFKNNSTDLVNGSCTTGYNSYTFQKQNVVYRIRIVTKDGDSRWNDITTLNKAISIANEVASQIP